MTARWTALACTLAAACAVVLLVASPALAVTKIFWGPQEKDGQSQLPIYQDLGVDYLQLQLRWDRIAPTRPANPTDPADPAYKWPKGLDQDILAAQAAGIRYAFMLMGSPPWANGGNADPFYQPLDNADYAAFAQAAAKRYTSVDHWMIWGEPNRLEIFKPTVTQRMGVMHLTPAQAAAPRKYAQMCDAAYAALKSVNPGNVVIGGMTYNLGTAIGSYNWVRYMKLPNGKPPRMDLWGHNPFGFKQPSLHRRPSPFGWVEYSDLGRFVKWIDKYRKGRPKVRLWLSEYTIPTEAPDKAFGDFFKPPDVVARWTRSAFNVARHLRRIAAVGWFSLYDDPPSTDGSPVSHEGLLYPDGTPKPGYYAFKAG
jgi:hypothetical protein